MTFKLGGQVKALQTLDCKPFATFNGCHLADAGDIAWITGINTDETLSIIFPKTDRSAVIPQEYLEPVEQTTP